MAKKINWFRNADYDAPRDPIPSVVKPAQPKPPKSIRPKKPKQTFHGPKNPGAYKRKLYVPHKFVQAAPVGMMTDEEIQALMPPIPVEQPEETEQSEEIENDEALLEPEIESEVGNGTDPVISGLNTIPNIAKITWEYRGEHDCAWCAALDGRTWYSVQDFYDDKQSLAKPGCQTEFLAHPHCYCRLKVETTDGQTEHVNSAGMRE